MFKNVFKYLKARPGLSLLLLLLAIISATNLKPDMYLLGWDNYSSYFNLKTNIFRTFFATWRQYRGVGVPSDSESTDLFRQLFYLLISPFVKTQSLDQVYILFVFNAGVISFYALAKTLARRMMHLHLAQEAIGFIAAISYIFNLNTLATFYFPMIMFINRFAAMPLLLLLFIRILEQGKRLKKRDCLMFAAVVIATSGSFMTATVFITFLFVLAVFILSQRARIVVSLGLFLFYIGINSFWLLPFGNYTIQKSKIVNDAPTFIEANEIQLNKPASFYSFEKQFIMYPSFFDTPITSYDQSQRAGYHSIINSLNNPVTKSIILLFSVAAMLGSLLILARIRKDWRFIWIPITYFIFLILSLKAFSPFGFLYVFMERHIPFFGNLFRFGDTKFHYFIALSGSLSVGYLFGFIAHRLTLKKTVPLIIILALCGLFVYRDYATGHLFGFFMRNSIPDAYFKIAQTVNTDKREGRVLHLPYDSSGYWRSYSWGYLGSSFLHFMIDRPLLEKTFEPGSPENAKINKEIYEATAHMQSMRLLGTQQSAVENMYEYLKKIGVRYLVMDGTVTSDQPSKGVSLWGTFNTSDSKALVDGMVEEGMIVKTFSYFVNPAEYLDLYEKQFSLSKEGIERIKKEAPQEIILYELIDPEPQIKMEREAIMYGKTQLFQDKAAQYSIVDGEVHMALNNASLSKNESYSLAIPSNYSGSDGSLLEVYGVMEKDNIVFSFVDSTIPSFAIGDRVLEDKNIVHEIKIPVKIVKDALDKRIALQDYLSNWHVLPYTQMNGLRLQIGDTVLPVPPLTTKRQYIAALHVATGASSVRILAGGESTQIKPSALHLTDKPNCFEDATGQYSSTLVSDYSGKIDIKSVNGSTCFLADLSPIVKPTDSYIELQMDYSAANKDLDTGSSSPSKKKLEQQIKAMKKPNNLYACLKDEAVSDCFNSHKVIDLRESGSVTLPTEKAFSVYKPILFFALKNTGLQEQHMNISKLTLMKYTPVAQSQMIVPPHRETTYNIVVDKKAPLSMRFRPPLNYTAFYQGSLDGFMLSNGTCSGTGSYRTFRKQGNDLVSYFVNCDNSMFVTLDFSSDPMYLWTVDYHLSSGKFPRFTLGDGFFNYKNEYLSLGQGYPNIEGFKEFQYPETLFSSDNDISSQIKNTSFKQTFTVIPPRPEYQDTGEKGYTIAHDAENEGMALYKSFTVMPLPNRWYPAAISNKKAEQSDMVEAKVTYSQILPSLWKVDVKGKGVLVFNEGYDAQWGLYGGLKDVFFGKELPNEHVRCNDYFNCFLLNEGTTPRYVFYWPERLSLLGWGIAILFAFVCLLLKIRNPLKLEA